MSGVLSPRLNAYLTECDCLRRSPDDYHPSSHIRRLACLLVVRLIQISSLDAGELWKDSDRHCSIVLDIDHAVAVPERERQAVSVFHY